VSHGRQASRRICNRAPVEDLVVRGVREGAKPCGLAASRDAYNVTATE
jgi:hypothetical protein